MQYILSRFVHVERTGKTWSKAGQVTRNPSSELSRNQACLDTEMNKVVYGIVRDTIWCQCSTHPHNLVHFSSFSEQLGARLQEAEPTGCQFARRKTLIESASAGSNTGQQACVKQAHKLSFFSLLFKLQATYDLTFLRTHQTSSFLPSSTWHAFDIELLSCRYTGGKLSPPLHSGCCNHRTHPASSNEVDADLLL